jgi:glycosyltransferase involved in cell wall biosynthesis
MLIGVDGACWPNKRGYGRHVRSLFGCLVQQDPASEYLFFLDSEEEMESLPQGSSVAFVRTRESSALAASADGYRSPGDMLRMSRALSRSDLDVLIFPSIYTYVPTLSRARKIVFVHDVIAETYPQLTLPNLRARLFWKAKVALGIRQAAAVITVSDYSREGILKLFRIPEDRVFVVGEASAPVFRRIEAPLLTPRLAALGISASQPMVVYVGGFGPHKNLERLLAAFAALPAQPPFDRAQLVLVGEHKEEVFHSGFKRLEAYSRNGLRGKILFTGYLPDEDVTVLLNLAQALVLPSLMEGFGLPAVEAAACGCPVIATQASPLPALLKEAALYIDPHRTEALQAALIRVLGSEELRRRMSAAGVAAAGTLTWSAAANQLRNVIRNVAGRQ